MCRKRNRAELKENTEFFVFNLDHSSPLINSDIIFAVAV
jgi:hypothetical protein